MSHKITSTIVTIAVISILILAGPADALILGISVAHKLINRGESQSFIISADAEDVENSINFFHLNLIGEDVEYSCKFYPDGTVIEGCEGMTIEILNSEIFNGYGYGYGYGYNHDYNKIELNLTLDTNDFEIGKYKTWLYLHDHRVRRKRASNFEILPDRKGLEECSVRGREGSLDVNGVGFGDMNKLSFYISDKNAAPGEGFITGRNGDTHFSYKFDFLEVLEYSPEFSKFSVSGEYKIGTGPKIEQDAIITLSEKKIVSIESSAINLQDMEVTFLKGC